MRAFKFQVTIGQDHRATVDILADAPTGSAEVIVLVGDPPAPKLGLRRLSRRVLDSTAGQPSR